MRSVSVALLALVLAMPAVAAVPDPAINNRIIDAAMNHGEVMQTVEYLTDHIGGRMTNSPQMRTAEQWTRQRFASYGLADARLEPFEFGVGWSIDSVAVRMLTPRVLPLHAIPVAWTPGTGGAISAPVIVAPLRRDRDFAKWRGKLAGKIVMVTLPGDGNEPEKPVFKRFDSTDLAKLDSFEQPDNDPDQLAKDVKDEDFAARRDAFLAAEGAKAWVSKSYRDGDLISGEGSGYAADDRRKLPGIQMAAEDYRRLARLAKGAAPVTLEIDTRVTFHEADTRANNVLADIPGRDPKAGFVMAGAHLDSWVGGDGAGDNAAGSAVVLEAARILAGLGVKPKRTIRFALWSGEEQGLYGSIAWLDQHMVSRAPLSDPALARANPYATWAQRWPITPKADFGQLAAYFNLDNGSGKIRGIYAEGNPAVVPIFNSWLAPFHAMGATEVVMSRTGGTDHVFMQTVGLPGFQFIQDPLDYDSRTHHSQVDTFDHLKAQDLRQAAVIMASFLWNAANSDEPLPRPPLPTKPNDSKPFDYPDDPDE